MTIWYRWDVFGVLNMVREELFGEMIYARCGYQHDSTPFIFNQDLEFNPGTGSVPSWSVIFSLSENSIAKGGAPVEFPDFTGGQWLRNEPIFHTNGEY